MSESAPFTVVPMVAIHPTKLNLYSECVWHEKKPFRKKRFHVEHVSKAHNGKVSENARRKINKAIEYLLFLSREKELPDTYNGKNYLFKLGFVTLTLPSKQVHTDKELKELCLNQFLIESKKKWNVRNYLWRAEKQENGNLHFHILVDKFIPWSELRDVWNRIVNKIGYVDRYRENMRAYHKGGFKVREDLLKHWSSANQLKSYNAQKVNDWNSPNSTDIHSIKKVSNIQAYISKYCTKDEQSEGIEGRIWGCNEALSNVKGAQLVVDNQIDSAIKDLFEKYSPNCYSGEYFSCVTIEFSMLTGLESDVLFKAFSDYLQDHFGVNYQRQTF